ncbi:hypothetical protein LXT21_40515 [Myxococcus sp. K38C18041901]|uniref:hypothetical protein n=1 Tax=Myxococcus guangdongensis TaxID=2906760 RepID=UPI0020A6FDE2|nr:hypothetical protein [Myxococcus guangdongensis]MCP3065074.1 hypothetical protein [Myxococcus guangdongensis]
MMGVNSVGGSGSGRGTSGSNSASGNDRASNAADAASKAEAARAEAAKAEAAQAEAAKVAEAAAIAAKVDFSVSSFTPAAAVTNMPSLTAPTFSMALASPTLNPSLTAPNFSAPSLMSATPLGPLDSFNPSLPDVGPVPATKPEQVADAQAAEVADGLRFGADANQDAVSAHTREVLGEIMATANVTSARITSTARTPEAQARAMYDNIQSTGVARQKSLYGAGGDAVIDTYSESVAAGLTKEQTLQAMVDRINELGPSSVSKHMADPTRLNVIDISPRSIPDSKKEAFEEAIRAHPEVSRFLGPSNNDPAYHLEIRQP